MSREAVAELVRERLGDEADSPFTGACHTATGGNPLLLTELLKVLESEGARPVADSVETVKDVGPRAASRAVLLRLARLRRDATAVARAIAVLGDGADPRLVAALAELEEQQAAESTGDLARAEILRSEPPLGFLHPLVGRATVESGDSTQFAGWLGLVAALDALLRDAPSDDDASRNLTVT